MNHIDETNITKEIGRIIFFLGLPSVAICGIGLYGVFVGNHGEGFFSFLNNEYISYGMVTVGGIMYFVEMALLLPLIKRKSDNEKSL